MKIIFKNKKYEIYAVKDNNKVIIKTISKDDKNYCDNNELNVVERAYIYKQINKYLKKRYIA